MIFCYLTPPALVAGGAATATVQNMMIFAVTGILFHAMLGMMGKTLRVAMHVLFSYYFTPLAHDFA